MSVSVLSLTPSIIGARCDSLSNVPDLIYRGIHSSISCFNRPATLEELRDDTIIFPYAETNMEFFQSFLLSCRNYCAICQLPLNCELSSTGHIKKIREEEELSADWIDNVATVDQFGKIHHDYFHSSCGEQFAKTQACFECNQPIAFTGQDRICTGKLCSERVTPLHKACCFYPLEHGSELYNAGFLNGITNKAFTNCLLCRDCGATVKELICSPEAVTIYDK